MEGIKIFKRKLKPIICDFLTSKIGRYNNLDHCYSERVAEINFILEDRLHTCTQFNLKLIFQKNIHKIFLFIDERNRESLKLDTSANPK